MAPNAAGRTRSDGTARGFVGRGLVSNEPYPGIVMFVLVLLLSAGRAPGSPRTADEDSFDLGPGRSERPAAFPISLAGFRWQEFQEPEAARRTLLSRARRLLSSGQYEKAHALLRGVYLIDPGDTELVFLFGRAALETGRYEEAATAFEMVLATNPGHQRARLELAECHYHLNSFHLARRYFTDVLGTDPPENVRRNIQSFLAGVDETNRRSFFSGMAAAGIQWDSNPLLSPDENVFQTPTGPLILDPDSRKKPDTAFFTTVLLDHSYRLFDGQTCWWKTSAVNYNAFYHDRKDLDQNYFSIAAGPALETDVLFVEPRAVATLILQDHERYLESYGANLTATGILSSWLLLSGTFTYEKKNYKATEKRFLTETFSDGENFAFDVGPIVIWGRHQIYSEFGLEWENADDRTLSYNRRHALVRYDVALPSDFFGSVGYEFQDDVYDGIDPVFLKRRKDYTHTFSVAVKKRLWRGLWAELGYIRTASSSSVPIYEYDRDLFSMSVTYTF